MKVAFSLSTVLAVALTLNGVESFQSAPVSVRESTSLHGYVPSGFTPEQYKKFKEAEAKKKAKKNLGSMGPKGRKFTEYCISDLFFVVANLKGASVLQVSRAALSRVFRKRWSEVKPPTSCLS